MRKLASRLQVRLEAALSEGIDANGMTEIAVSIWIEVASVFSPIIGNGGMSALYRRAVSLTLVSFPALGIALQDTAEKNTFNGLRQALSELPRAEIAAANEALLRNFFELLATLIGGPLTERLLNNHPAMVATGNSPKGTAK